MKSGIEQLKALIEEKSVAEVAGKAQLSRASLYNILNHGKLAGKKIRENLFPAYSIPVESWGGEPVAAPEPGLSEVPVLKIKEGIQFSKGTRGCEGCLLEHVLEHVDDCYRMLSLLMGVSCGKYILAKIGEWGPAKPENIAPGDTVRRVERPDLHFTVVTLLKESTTFHNKAVLRPVGESGDDILADLTNFEVYTEV